MTRTAALLLLAAGLPACAPAPASVSVSEHPVPMLTTDVYVLDRDLHLQCLTDCTHVDIDPDATYQRVKGDLHACALRTDQTVECWGPHDFGGLVPEGRFRDVTADTGVACGIDLDGEVDCWGQDADTYQSFAPPGPWDRIEAGHRAFCVWSSVQGAVSCFDRRGTTEPELGYENIVVEGYAGCGLAQGNTVDCFRGDAGFNGNRLFVKQMDMAGSWNCVLMQETRSRQEGELVCTGDTEPPVGVFDDLAAGEGNACVVTSDGEVLCWGYDFIWGVESLGRFL